MKFWRKESNKRGAR